ncbi:DUF4938 domain-containing protein [Kallotenue papyrolyticum]|uniref:DUF4938 domain-containing protein n=1 Tax=Kallotenue papyrolyticum TaxID=1325125 RepID=UPI000492D44A|nr:DUF4938 domain-containing protein [Kallotenue papyrolyticum]
MALELRALRALEGPNIYYPQPAVELVVWAEHDLRTALADTVKTWAQQVGIVIAQLRQELQPENSGLLITTTWVTPLPRTGALIAEGAFRDLEAAARGDRGYSHDDLLWRAIAQRRREEPSLAQLQLAAEAQVRDLPLLPREDGTLMIGSGARGHVVAPTALAQDQDPALPWETIGTIPLVAISGTARAEAVAALLVRLLSELGARVGYAAGAAVSIAGAPVATADSAWSAARRVLSDAAVDVAVLAIPPVAIIEHGLAFDACTVSVVLPPTDARAAQAAGVVVGVTRPDGATILAADDPWRSALQARAAAPVLLVGEAPFDWGSLGASAALWPSAGQIVLDLGAQRQTLTLAEAGLEPAGMPDTAVLLPALAAALVLGAPPETLAGALRALNSS